MSKSGNFYRVQAPLSRRARRAELFQSAHGVQAMPIISYFKRKGINKIGDGEEIINGVQAKIFGVIKLFTKKIYRVHRTSFPDWKNGKSHYSTFSMNY